MATIYLKDIFRWRILASSKHEICNIMRLSQNKRDAKLCAICSDISEQAHTHVQLKCMPHAQQRVNRCIFYVMHIKNPAVPKNVRNLGRIRWAQKMPSLFELTQRDLANWSMVISASDIVPRAIVFSKHVNTVLNRIPVVRLLSSPVRVRQFSARYVRYKRSLRRHVSAVDVQKPDRFVYKQKSSECRLH